MPKTTDFSMERGQLVGALKAVLTSASKDLTRPHLAGVLLETLPDNSLARFVSTDGHRLTRIDCALHPEFEAPKDASSALLPIDTVKGLISSLKSVARDAAHPINIAIGADTVEFDDPCNGGKQTVKSADDGILFPPYAKVIPDYSKASRKSCNAIGYNPRYMADVAKVASFAANDASGGVRQSIGGDRDPIRIDMENGRAAAVVVIMPMRT